MTEKRFREYRTRDQLNKLLHYGHWIPMRRGFTLRHVEENFPGWTWNELMAIWHAARILDPTRRPGGEPACLPTVKGVHFTSPDDFLVEWEDGRATGPDPDAPPHKAFGPGTIVLADLDKDGNPIDKRSPGGGVADDR